MKNKFEFYRNQLQGHPSLSMVDVSTEGLKERIGNHLFPCKILCVGAATGMEIKAFNELGYEAQGITLGQNNVDFGRKEYNVDIQVMDMHDLQFPHDTFDALYSSHNLEHAFLPLIHLMECWTVLKHGGKWFMVLPSYDPNGCDSQQISAHHPNLLPAEVHEQMFTVCGFNIIWRGHVGEEYRWVLQKDGKLSNVHSSIRTCLENRKNYKE